MKKYFNKKNIILIIIVLLILITIVLNFDNIKRITGNVLLNESYETTITEELINKMNTGDIIGEIQSDSSVHENKLSYVNFDSEEHSKMSILESTKRPGIYSLRSILKFSNNNSKKQIRVTLHESVRYEYDGFGEIQKDLLNGAKGDIITENVTSTLLGVEYNYNNGTKTYNLKNNVEMTTLTLNVSPNTSLDFSTVNDAITIELIEDDKVINSKVIGVDFDFSYISPTYTGTNKTLYGGNAESYIQDMRLFGFYLSKVNSRYVLVKDIIYTLKVPKNVIYAGLINQRMSFGSASSSNYICEKYDVNNNRYDCNEQIQDSRDYDIYKFRSEKPYRETTFGINPKWIFPTGYFEKGDKIEISAEKLEYQIYGGQRHVLEGENIRLCSSKKCATTFEITDSSAIVPEGKNITLAAFNESEKEALVGLSYFNFKNASPIETKSEKEIVYEFSDLVSVKEVIIPVIFEKQTRICYKSDLKKEWTCNNNFMIANEYDIKNYSAMKITLDKLGDTESNEITSLKYNIGKIPGYFYLGYEIPSLGYIKEKEILTEEGTMKTFPESFVTTYQINDVSNDVGVSKETLSVDITTVGINKYKQMGLYPENDIPSSAINVGNTVKFNSRINLYGTSMFHHRNIYKPIIYIRNYFKQPIKNVKLLLSDNAQNKNAIDVTERFNISYKIDNEGYYVYKIDIKKNEQVKIGNIKYKHDNNAQQWLVLSYQIDIPKTFYFTSNFDLRDTVFVDSYDSVVSSGTTELIRPGDPYDVDFDGITADDKMVGAIKNSIFRVVSPLDLNIDIKQKSSLESNYVYKENTNIDFSKLLNLNVVINNPVDINIKNSVIYIPVPKKGNKFIDKIFDVDMKLNEFLKEEENLKITYSKEENISSYDELSNSRFLTRSEMNKDDVSIIRIELLDVKTKETKNIYYDLVLVNDTLENVEENFNFVYYRDFRFETIARSGYEKGNDVAFTQMPGKYKLKIIHKTIYNTILQVGNEEYTYNAKYKTNPIIKDGFEVFEIIGEESGFIKENTEITYIYRPSKLIEVKIEHILKDTNQKIIDDVILKGKVLDKYSYEPKSIDGYKLLDNKKIEGIFEKENKTYVVYYEEKKTIIESIINNPSTFDSVMLYIILFVLSIIGILLCIYYFKKFSLIYNNKK